MMSATHTAPRPDDANRVLEFIPTHYGKPPIFCPVRWTTFVQ